LALEDLQRRAWQEAAHGTVIPESQESLSPPRKYHDEAQIVSSQQTIVSDATERRSSQPGQDATSSSMVVPKKRGRKPKSPALALQPSDAGTRTGEAEDKAAEQPLDKQPKKRGRPKKSDAEKMASKQISTNGIANNKSVQPPASNGVVIDKNDSGPAHADNALQTIVTPEAKRKVGRPRKTPISKPAVLNISSSNKSREEGQNSGPVAVVPTPKKRGRPPKVKAAEKPEVLNVAPTSEKKNTETDGIASTEELAITKPFVKDPINHEKEAGSKPGADQARAAKEAKKYKISVSSDEEDEGDAESTVILAEPHTASSKPLGTPSHVSGDIEKSRTKGTDDNNEDSNDDDDDDDDSSDSDEDSGRSSPEPLKKPRAVKAPTNSKPQAGTKLVPLRSSPESQPKAGTESLLPESIETPTKNASDSVVSTQSASKSTPQRSLSGVSKLSSLASKGIPEVNERTSAVRTSLSQTTKAAPKSSQQGEWFFRSLVAGFAYCC
jgi:hypothetical protein